MEPHTPKEKPFFENFAPKQAFWLGFAAAILCIGTLGFVILGSCVLKGECAVDGFAAADQEDDDDASGFAVADDADDDDTVAAASVPAVSDDEYIRGDADAPITIIEYSDFECPFCARFHETMLEVMDEYDGDVRWIYRHFPLSFHAEAGPAALAAECAGAQGSFWDYADALIENQDSLGGELFAQLASDLGLNTGDWQTCYDNETYADKVSSDATNGAKAGVTGTPGSFIIDADGNATPIKGALPFESVAAAIDEML